MEETCLFSQALSNICLLAPESAILEALVLIPIRCLPIKIAELLESPRDVLYGCAQAGTFAAGNSVLILIVEKSLYVGID